MKSVSSGRWAALWRAAGASNHFQQGYLQLRSRYSEAHRAYHNLRHLGECLTEFDSAGRLAEDPIAVELALWFHDAVYDPQATDNEEQSARLALDALANAGLATALAGRVRALILATKHTRRPDAGDASLVVDIDLAILGQVKKRFNQYERGIRLEYLWVPADVFARKRAEILKGFLQRDAIYATPWFAEKYEKQARQNLAASVEKLESTLSKIDSRC